MAAKETRPQTIASIKNEFNLIEKQGEQPERKILFQEI